VSESAVSAKRGWGSFGAKAAQSETPVGAAAKRRPPGRGVVEDGRVATIELLFEIFCKLLGLREMAVKECRPNG